MTQILTLCHSNRKQMDMATNTRKNEHLVHSKLSLQNKLLFREHVVCAKY